MPVCSEKTGYATCPVCSSAIRTWRVKMVGNESYNLDLCKSCGYAFVNPRPSLSFVMTYYSSVGHAGRGNVAPTLKSVLAQEQKDPNSTIDARRLIRTIRSLIGNNQGGKFLDVGCGYGFFSKEALDAGFEVIALEMAENEREIAREMTGLDPVACSFEAFECIPGSMSVVFMSQVLEHAADINLWISTAHNFLVDGGILAIALPNYDSIFRLIMQENEPYIYPPAHLNFFSPNSLSNCWEIIHLGWKQYSGSQEYREMRSKDVCQNCFCQSLIEPHRFR